jgi:hypothetical protein
LNPVFVYWSALFGQYFSLRPTDEDKRPFRNTYGKIGTLRNEMTRDEASVFRYDAETKTPNLLNGKGAQMSKPKIEIIYMLS